MALLLMSHSWDIKLLRGSWKNLYPNFLVSACVSALNKGVITKAVHKSSEEEKKEEEVKKTLEQHDSIVTQYKELIREQDAQINELKAQVASMTSQSEQMQATITQQLTQIQQHKDQYNILKLKLGKTGDQSASQGEGAHVNGLQSEELSQLREELEELRRQHAQQQTQLAEQDTLIASLKSEAAHSAEAAEGTSANAELLKELEALRAQVMSQAADINQLTESQELLRRAEAVQSGPGSVDNGVDMARVAELEKQLAAQSTEAQKLQEEVKGLNASRAGMEADLASATSTAAILQAEVSKLQQEVQESKKEQDDLLMLLADQDQKILTLKQKLKDLGETIEDEDDLDSKDQSEDDEDEEEEEEDDE